MQNKNVLLLVTGSISAYKAASIASGLQKNYCFVKVAMTEAATKIIGAAAMGGVTHEEVALDENWFTQSQKVPHINLAKWADIVLVCPATSNTIAKLAHGISDNVVTATVLAASGMGKRIVIAPAMNCNMYESKANQKNMEICKEYGYEFIAPKVGLLACGDEGIGHLKSTREIISELLAPYKKDGE